MKAAPAGALRRSMVVWLSKRQMLPCKLRRSLVKRFDPGMLADYAFVRPFFDRSTGLRFSGNMANAIDRYVYFFGAYEKFMLCMMRDYMQALRELGEGPLSFVDVGANVGNHTLYMSKVADRVVAFEPFARVRQQMADNLALNHVANVTVYPFGLSNTNGDMPFYEAQAGNLGASSFAKTHTADCHYLGDMGLRVGDEVLGELGLERVDILKVDVEGFEMEVLQGLAQTLKKSRPLIIVELTPTTCLSVKDADTFRSLFPEDYNFYYFSKGDRVSGVYHLFAYSYGMTPRNENIVACPQERMDTLLNAGI